MVQVQVQVSHLAIDIDGNQIVFRTGDCFEIPIDRATSLGTSVKILDIPPVVHEPEPNPPDNVLEIQKPKSNSRRRR